MKSENFVKIDDDDKNSFKSNITVNLNNYNFEKNYYFEKTDMKNMINILVCNESQIFMTKLERFLKKNL
jgi:hypothetical protein